MDAVLAKYRPRLEGKKVMLYCRRPAAAARDRRLRRPRHGGRRHRLRVRPQRRLSAHTHYIKDGTLIYDDVTGYEFEKFVEKIQPDLVGSGIKEKYVFQKMGVPFRQMHSWDYSGPYHGYDGFAMFARDMDMAINSPVWGLTKAPLERNRRAKTARAAPPAERESGMPKDRGLIMTQNAENVFDHFELFRGPEYQEMFENKKRSSRMPRPTAEVERVSEWTKTPEYREKNFAREALTVNPAKACQPLGAVFAAVGFEGTLPFVHGSQGCVAYYRSHFSRHFKEPTSCVSSSMTEDAAVFGGLNNMIDGLANAYNLYKPKMIAVSTTCMAEVIGDDLNAFIKTSKEKGSVPADFDVPFAHTPAFVGSHITGYDNVMKGMVEHFWGGKAGTGRSRAAAERQDQLLRRLRRLHSRQHARNQAHLRPDGRRIHDPRRQQRRVGYADRWRVPHV